MQRLVDEKSHDQGFTVETSHVCVCIVQVISHRTDSGKHKLILLNIAITGNEYDGHMNFEGAGK
jgi:hypothetical protein